MRGAQSQISQGVSENGVRLARGVGSPVMAGSLFANGKRTGRNVRIWSIVKSVPAVTARQTSGDNEIKLKSVVGGPLQKSGGAVPALPSTLAPRS